MTTTCAQLGRQWFATSDARELDFLHQEERKDGNQGTFFRLESPDREDG